MAGIVQLPAAPSGGLASLGNILLASAQDYAQEKRTSDREKELRAQRLQDVADERSYQRGQLADARSYEEKRHAALHEEQLADMDAREQLAMKALLEKGGYLAPADFDKPDLVQAAYAKAQRDGLVDRYKELIGSGLLNPADVQDPARVEGALATAGNLAAAKTQAGREDVGHARDRANQLASERTALAARATKLEQALGEPEPAPAPQAVVALATKMAQDAIQPPGAIRSFFGGTKAVPSQDQIAQNIDAAKQALQGDLNQQWARAKQDAIVQRSILQDQLKDITSEINTLENKFGAVGVSQGAPTPLVSPDVGGAGSRAPQAQAVDPATARAKFLSDVVSAVKGARGGGTDTAGNPIASATAPSGYSRDNPAPLSLLGLLHQAPTTSDMLAAPANIAAAPGRAIDTAGRYLSAGLEGALSGNYSVPPKGMLEVAGEGIGSAIAGDPYSKFLGDQSIGVSQREAEDRILSRDPNSPMAAEIRRRRAQQDTQRAQSFTEPVNTPNQFVPPAALQYQLLEPSYGN